MTRASVSTSRASAPMPASTSAGLVEPLLGFGEAAVAGGEAAEVAEGPSGARPPPAGGPELVRLAEEDLGFRQPALIGTDLADVVEVDGVVDERPRLAVGLDRPLPALTTASSHSPSQYAAVPISL